MLFISISCQCTLQREYLEIMEKASEGYSSENKCLFNIMTSKIKKTTKYSIDSRKLRRYNTFGVNGCMFELCSIAMIEKERMQWENISVQTVFAVRRALC